MSCYVELVRTRSAEHRASVQALAERRQRLLVGMHEPKARPRPTSGYATRSAHTLALRPDGGAPERNATGTARGADAAQPASRAPHQQPLGAGGTRLSRFKEMEQAAARLVAELERSDREWRHCVHRLEARLENAEAENAQLRRALAATEAALGVDPARARATLGREPVTPPGAPQSRHAATRPHGGGGTGVCRPASSPPRVGGACARGVKDSSTEWWAHRALGQRAAQLSSAEHWTAELTAAGQDALHGLPVRLRRRSELFTRGQSDSDWAHGQC